MFRCRKDENHKIFIDDNSIKERLKIYLYNLFNVHGIANLGLEIKTYGKFKYCRFFKKY